MSIVRFGLNKTKYFTITRGENGVATFGTIKNADNAISMSMSREGGDSVDVYADNKVIYTFAGTNGGYSIDWEFARVSNTMRKDWLGEVTDEKGVQWEFGDQEPAEMGIITEVLGDAGPTAFVFFGLKASRIEMTANTTNDSPSNDSETMHTRCTGIPLKYYDGTTESVKNCIKGFLDKTADNATEYEAFFTSVTVPPVKPTE